MNVATIAGANRLSSYMTAVDQTVINGIDRPTISSANGLRVVYAGQQLLVKSEEDGPVTVGIYNAGGILVEQTTVVVKGGRACVDISHLTPGLYITRAFDAYGTNVSCKYKKNR
jgi:hypothetical protein